MRLFVALYPPEPALDHLATAVGRLRLGLAAAAGATVRLTARPLWHVTLVFLGEVPEDRRLEVTEALDTGVARWRGTEAASPLLRLAGSGRFGRVLWVDVAGEVDNLLLLGNQVRRSLRRAGLPFDPRPLRPHLTFARPGDGVPAADLAADLATLAAYEGPVWRLDEIHLVRSRLGPKPVYERLTAVPLRS